MARKIEVQIVGDSKSLERTFARAGASARGFDSSTRNIGRNLTRSVAAVGAATAGLGIVTSKSFSSFEQTMDRVVGLAGGARDAVDRMSKEVLRLGPQVAKGPQELGEALYFVASAGIAVDKQMQVVNLSARASAAGLGQTQQVADAVTSAMNAYGPAVVGAARATDVLVNTVKFGKGEAEAFAPVIGTVAALAAQLGVRFEEVGAALAAQTRLGTSAETAAVQLQATFSSLLKVTPKQAKALESVGLSAEALRDQLRKEGLLSLLDTLQTSFQGNTAAMAEAFPNIRALRGLLSLLGANAAGTREVFDGMRDSTGALGTAFDAVSKGEAFRFRQTIASLQAASIRLGAIFAPVANIIARGTTAALGVVNNFLEKLGEARTIRTKLAVIWEGVEDAAEGAQDLLGKAVRKIDFDKVFAEAQGIADGLQRRLEEVDFGIVGERIGQAFVDAVEIAVPAAKDMAERVNQAVRAIDFEELGKRLGPGLAAAVVTAFVTLLDPSFWLRNWDLALAVAATVFRARIATLAAKLLAPLGRLGGTMVLGIVSGIERVSPRLASALLSALTALPRIAARALSPLTGLVGRVFGRLGRLAKFTITVLGIQVAINAVIGFASRVGSVFKNLGASIAGAFDRAWNFIKQRALRAALEIIEPFTHIPGFLGGGVFQDLKAKWEQTLADMESNTKSTTRTIQSAIDSIEGKTVEVDIITRLKTIVETATDVGGETRPPTGNVRDARVASSAAVAREEAERASRAAAAQTAAAEKAAAARKAAARAAARAAAAAKKAQEEAIEAFGVLMESLALKLDIAGATKGFADDLRVLREQERAIKAEIAVEGRTAALERQLFDIRQQRADIRRQIAEQRRTARQERQFQALGLTAEGDQSIPGVGALAKRLQSVKAAVKGTFLDTQKTRTEFARIAKVLAEGPKKVGRDVRAAILRMLNDISGALDSGGKKGPLTKFQKRGVGDFLKNVTGLTPEQIKQLRQNFSQFSPGAAPQVRVSTAGGGSVSADRSRQAIVIENRLFLDSKEIAFSTRRHEQKRDARTSGSRRGQRAGHR